jgi:hypothetical protein
MMRSSTPVSEEGAGVVFFGAMGGGANCTASREEEVVIQIRAG